MMTSGYNITDLVQEAQIRWLKPGEVLFILQNFEEKQLTNEPPQKPPSGSLFLFNKRVLRFFRTDGHNWRKKKDGRTVGEAYERLKVGNVEALNCYYAHGELNPNFQRRCYWMLDQGMEHIVLVHYRDVTIDPKQCDPVKQLEANAFNNANAISNESEFSANKQTYGGMQDDSINFASEQYPGYNITDLVQEAQIRWLKPGEVLFILQNFEEEQLTNEPPQKPPRGSLFLFNKRVLRFFRKDGHNWRKKKDGRTVGEAHERLKVGNVEALNCYYAHSEPDPKFQRRSYWMLDPEMDHIVLVHYRDVSLSYTLKAVLFATNNFSQENLITESPLGKVYRGQGLRYKNLVIQRLDSKYGQGNELHTEILTLKRLEHKNIASLFEYWVENNEKILIYKAFQGTLNQHLSDPTLTWSQRLQICIGVARALNHIHSDIIHCDINSSKIILDENWEPNIYGFELSTKYPRSWRHRLLLSHHFDTNNLTPKYDVYSFGVLLLEVLCGRKPMITNDGIEEELEEIIGHSLRTQMDTQALALFIDIAYKCLNQQHVQRPTMDQIIKELEGVLELQWEHTELKEQSIAIAADEDTPFNILKIPLREIRQATNGFNKACFVGSGGYADVYRAKLDVLNMEGLLSMEGKSKDKLPKISRTVAIKRISSRVDEQGKQGFLTELELLTRCKHPNIVSLLGFCRESGEMILVYEYAFKGSLADYLISSDKTPVILPWVQRIKICLDIAHGISYLHTDMEAKPRIIHRDIKSDNILLDENMNAKLADFGLSKSHPMNQQPSTIYSKNIAGTTIYMDPEYLSTGKYKRESDIYSFGVVLFEVLSGRVAYDSIYTSESDLGLAPIARRRFNEGTLQELIDPKIIEEDDDDHIFTLNRGPNQDSFHTFSKIAYQCLAETQAKRPTINTVIKELQNALEAQGETVVLSRSRLIDIVSATENFAESYCIGLDTTGTVYKAELHHFSNNNSLATKRKYNGEPSKKRITVAIKRITCRDNGQGKQEFFEEIEMRTSYQHPNVVPLLGFCNEGDEMILVYESVAERSLNDYFKSVDKMDTFTWSQRLYMCLEIARGLDHLHTKIANPRRIIHVDIKSANILLDKNRGAKIGYFVTSELRSVANEDIGMKVYKDPEYETEGKLKENSDVYSFGVILFEIFCGRLAYDPVYIVENDEGLAPIARQRFDDGIIESMMDPKLKEEADEDINTSNRGPNKDSLATFLNIAYQCLEEANMRPNMRLVIKELEKAIDYHRRDQ